MFDEKGCNPRDVYNADQNLKAIVDWIGSNYFASGEPGVLKPLKDSLLEGGDPFKALADFDAYCRSQEEVDVAFRDKSRWARMAILNTARVGKFSSDRTISEYAKEIWKLKPVKVK